MTGIHYICNICIDNVRFNGNYNVKILGYGKRKNKGRCEFCNRRNDYLCEVEIKKRGE